MKLKKGDKVYCINNLGSGTRIHEKGNFYDIDEVVTYDEISHDDSSPDIPCVIINDNRIGRTAFLLERYRDCYYFYDYFITLKELRKQKLNNIK